MLERNSLGIEVEEEVQDRRDCCGLEGLDLRTRLDTSEEVVSGRSEILDCTHTDRTERAEGAPRSLGTRCTGERRKL